MSTATPIRSGQSTAEAVPQDRQPNRRRRTWLIVAAAVLAVVLGVWLVAFSPVFGASTIKVTGLRTLTADQVRTAADIRHGEPLVRLDAGVIARRVESLPAVASASVRTSFPNTVTIAITERTAVGYLAESGHDVLIDRDGVQFRTVSSAPANLPLFAVPSGAQQKATAGAVAEVAAALPAALRAKIASIQAFDAGSITLRLGDGRVVSWGSADRSADKAKILPALLAQPGTSFDVSNPDLVVAH